MLIYADLRCLQDARFAARGVGLHTAGVLRQARRWLPGPVRLVGLIDPDLPALADDARALVDETQGSLMPRLPADGRRAVFLQTSPMTHDGDALASLLGRPGLLSCALVYDFIPLDEPRYLPTPAARRNYLAALAVLKRYDLFCPISQHSGQRLREVLGVAASRLAVTGAVVRPAFADFDPAGPAEAVPGAPPAGRYFVMVGGHCLRKNTECAVREQARLSAERPGVALVVVGHYGADYREYLENLYREAGGRPGGLVFLSGLSDGQLAWLYHRALAAVCPSRLEGFSLPVAEAIACGCPVLASDIPVHRELLGRTGLFPVERPEDLYRALADLTAAPATRARLLAEQQGFTRTPDGNRFREEEVGRLALRHVARHLPAMRTPNVLADRTARPRLAFVTPYPPDRSGVADYTAVTLRHLAEHALIDVYTDAPAPRRDPWVRRFGPIDERPYRSAEYDRVVSVVGNSHFHSAVIDLHRQHGGPCLIHDNKLIELYAWWKGPEKFAGLASRYLGRPVSVAESQAWLGGACRVPTLFFEECLERADPLLLHSRGIAANVKRLYRRDAVCLPFCCYRHFDSQELGDQGRRAARRALGVADDRFLVITLGIPGPTKGPLDCLWALEQLRAWGVPAELHFVGEAAPALRDYLQGQADLAGVGGHVRLLSQWIGDDLYRRYLVAADCAIQLRTHGLGGLSGAVADCISAGLPTVANEDLARSMEGPSYVADVPDHFSPTLIAEQMRHIHDDGRHRRRLSPERDAYLADHHPAAYARLMMTALGLPVREAGGPRARAA